jgi:hypothetical protein
VLGACWYKGIVAGVNGALDNCNQTCEKVGKIYDSRTATIAGAPQGSAANCREVSMEFGQSFIADAGCDTPAGCIFIGLGAAFRCTQPTTADAPADSDGVSYNNNWTAFGRYCACK